MFRLLLSAERPASSPPEHREAAGERSSVAMLSEHGLLRGGVAALLRAHGFPHVREFKDVDELIQARRRAPSIVTIVVDLDHVAGDTLALMRVLRNALPDAHLVVMGTALRQVAVEVAASPGVETPGADLVALVAAISAAQAAGGRSTSPELALLRRAWSRLTPRQRDVLRWLPSGADNRTIGEQLRIGERAVKAHITSLLATLDLENRTQLAVLADRAGLRPPARAARNTSDPNEFF